MYAKYISKTENEIMAIHAKPLKLLSSLLVCLENSLKHSLATLLPADDFSYSEPLVLSYVWDALLAHSEGVEACKLKLINNSNNSNILFSMA